MTDEARNTNDVTEEEMPINEYMSPELVAAYCTSSRIHEALGFVKQEEGETRPTAPKGVADGIHLWLDQLTGSPENFDDDAFGALADAFGKANAGAWCPCGTGATFAGCCKTRWLPAARAWYRRQKEGAATKKEEIKHVKRQEGKDNVTWLGMIGIDHEKGPLVAPCPGNEGYDLYALVGVLPGILNTLLGMKIKNDILMEMQEIGKKARQAESQQQILDGAGRA